MPQSLQLKLLSRITSKKLRDDQQNHPAGLRYEVRFQVFNYVELHVVDEFLALMPEKSTEPKTGWGIGGKRPQTWRSIIQRELGKPATLVPEYQGRKKYVLKLEPQELAFANVPRDVEQFPATVWLRDFLEREVLFYQPAWAKLRQACPPGQPATLRADAINLPWLVLNLKRQNQDSFEFWVDHVKVALPNLVGIDAVEREEDHHAYLKLEYESGYSVTSSGLSDGTLHILALTIVPYLNPGNPHMTDLARRSADLHYRRLPGFIGSHFTVKKLDELANYLHKRSKLAPASTEFTITEVLSLLKPDRKSDREAFANARLTQLIERYGQGVDSTIPPEVERILSLRLEDFDTYIEILVELRGSYHRGALIDCLDSLMRKNSDSGLLRQSRAKGRPRWFVLGSRLLEVLLQIAVLEPKGTGFTTHEVRVDELLTFLRERYGLYIDRLPHVDGYSEPSIIDQQALRKNVATFKSRLRDIGFFQDLSDAYVTQTVVPRYAIVDAES